MHIESQKLGSIILDGLRYAFIKNSFRLIGHKSILLDVGCADKPYQHVYEEYLTNSIGIDVFFTPYEKGKIDVYSKGDALPFKSCIFDIVLCTEVMEHVGDPLCLLIEMRRVLKAGGHLILTTPFLVPVHDAPYDFYRYTIHGLEHLIERARLSVISIEKFCELFGVTLSFLVRIQLKAWYMITKILKYEIIYSKMNPFIFLFVYIPQLAYVEAIKRLQSFGLLKGIIEKLAYATCGYGIVVKK